MLQLRPEGQGLKARGKGGGKGEGIEDQGGELLAILINWQFWGKMVVRKAVLNVAKIFPENELLCDNHR